MPIRNCFLLLALIFSYHLFGQNTVSIFILDSENKVDSDWIAIRYIQVGFTPSISISEINTTLNTSNFDVEINYDTDYINTYYFQNATSGGNNNYYL